MWSTSESNDIINPHNYHFHQNCHFKIFYALAQNILQINTYFAILIDTLKHYVLQCIKASQYFPISGDKTVSQSYQHILDALLVRRTSPQQSETMEHLLQGMRTKQLLYILLFLRPVQINMYAALIY